MFQSTRSPGTQLGQAGAFLFGVRVPTGVIGPNDAQHLGHFPRIQPDATAAFDTEVQSGPLGGLHCGQWGWTSGTVQVKGIMT